MAFSAAIPLDPVDDSAGARASRLARQLRDLAGRYDQLAGTLHEYGDPEPGDLATADDCQRQLSQTLDAARRLGEALHMCEPGRTQHLTDNYLTYDELAERYAVVP